MFSSRFSQRGDTIIEVLVAIAVVSSVVITAFSVVNRTTKNTRQAQEHSASLKLVESQVERLKLLAANPSPGPNSDVFSTTGDFCISDAGAVVLISSPFPSACVQGVNEQRLSISRNGEIFTARAVWEGPVSGEDRVEIIYRAVDPTP